MTARRFDHVTVINVVDGDTCDVMVDLGFYSFTKQRLRLARIDTPERGQAGWTEATALLKQMALNRAAVIDVTKADRYGRFLAEITIDGANVNDAMLAAGVAQEYA